MSLYKVCDKNHNFTKLLEFLMHMFVGTGHLPYPQIVSAIVVSAYKTINALRVLLHFPIFTEGL